MQARSHVSTFPQPFPLSTLTNVSIRFTIALNLPVVKTPKIAPTKAKPVAAIPMQYRTNMILLAVSTTAITSLIASGHLRSSSLNLGFNSPSRMLVGSKWKRPVEFEQCVTFFFGWKVSLLTGEGV